MKACKCGAAGKSGKAARIVMVGKGGAAGKILKVANCGGKCGEAGKCGGKCGAGARLGNGAAPLPMARQMLRSEARVAALTAHIESRVAQDPSIWVGKRLHMGPRP